ncbi:DUF885 domain-containing protein [Henriciella litoralis]|uniref:DUF885 domain-containing protein n=1 Tax=Henriciella litoralis TaxID=568102 RepID=UPI000A036C12|nr:DUF885 domain-containing protein [Henriciella litoralis]
MNIRYLLPAFAIAAALPACAHQTSAPAEAQTVEAPATLADIVDDYEALVLLDSPSAAARAENQAARRWSDVSDLHVSHMADRARHLKMRLDALDDHTAPEWAILSHLLDQMIAAETFDTARIPFTGDWGFHAEPFFAARSLKLKSADDADAWIARLYDVPRYFADHTTNMRRGVSNGWTAHTDPLGTTIEQVREQVVDMPEDSPLWAPFEDLPDTISDEDAVAIRRSGRQAVSAAIGAYADLLAYLETEYLPHARAEPGVVTLSGGRPYYAQEIKTHTAGAGYSPSEIHELGLSEVARIRAEMEIIIEELGYPGTFDEFLNFLRTDPQFYSETPEDLLEKAARISKRLDAILPQYFGKLPRLTYGVEPVPDAIAPGYTTGRYAGGDPEKGVSGTYLVNTYALDQRPLYELPALSAHEAVPGHHLQISLAQELEDVSRFRKQYYATAFGEGWGLYAEKLAGEAGIYQTPYERFGQLSYEMWRACRLVADTGMHWYGWSREEAEACFTDNSALAPLNIKTEVTRYIGWPGQATAYKMGELKILELRQTARDALGEDFDIRAFHDELLGAGSLPLDALEVRIKAWIERQLSVDEPEPTVPA